MYLLGTSFKNNLTANGGETNPAPASFEYRTNHGLRGTDRVCGGRVQQKRQLLMMKETDSLSVRLSLSISKRTLSTQPGTL